MLQSINKKTGRIVKAFNLEINQEYPFPHEEKWLADPNQIENYNEKIEELKEIKTVYVTDRKYINFNGTKCWTAPHFRIPNANKLGINAIPESPEHKAANNWIYTQLKNNTLKLNYSSINKPFKYSNTIKLSELNINQDLIGMEHIMTNGINTRRVDIHCPFKKFNKLFGSGIVFEIQFSKQRQKTEDDRTYDSTMKCQSIIWLHQSDFDKDECHITLKSNSIKITPWAAMLKHCTKQNVKNLKTETANEIIKHNNSLINLKEELEKVSEELKLQKELHETNVNNSLLSHKLSLQRTYDSFIEKTSEQISKDVSRNLDNNFFDNNINKIRGILEDNISESLNIESIAINLIQSKLLQDINYRKIKESIDNWTTNYLKLRVIMSNPPECKLCGRALQLKEGKYGEFWGCPGFTDAGCRAKSLALLQKEKVILDGLD